MKTTWTKSALLGLKYWEMPSVRCRYKGKNEGGRVAEVRDSAGPWVEIHRSEDGGWIAMQISWSLLLAVLNDPYEPPIDISQEPKRWTSPGSL